MTENDVNPPINNDPMEKKETNLSITPRKWLHEPIWISTVKVIHSLRFHVAKFLFLRNRLSDWSQIFCGASMGWRTKVWSNSVEHMTKMAAMPICGKNLKKSSFLEPKGRWPWKLVCSIGYSSTTKSVQMMTLGRPWPHLQQGQIWSLMLLYGKKVKQ